MNFKQFCLVASITACNLATISVANAGVGLTVLAGLDGDAAVTVFHPTASADQDVTRGPFSLRLAPDAPPERGNGRLIVVSHGSGGAPWVHTDLARALVEAGYTVAFPAHRGDRLGDDGEPGPESWKRRPAEVSRAIDAVARHPSLGAGLDTRRVGVFGGSAGGHTALSLAGGRWSPAQFRQHCEAHLADDFSSCVGYTTRLRGNRLDGLKKWLALGIIRQRFTDETWYTHHDERVVAVIAAVPFAADFDLASLAQPRAALGLVIAGGDINQVPRFHVQAVRAACKTCSVVAEFPQAGHGVMLSPLPPFAPGTIAAELNSDPPGFERAPAIAELERAVLRFFSQHVLAPSNPTVSRLE